MMQLDRPLILIRERGTLEQFDLALAVIRSRPSTIVATALAGIAPFAALNGALMWAFPDLAWSWPLWVVLEAQLATAPLTVVLGGMMFGERPRARRVARELGRSIAPLVWYSGVCRGFVIGSLVTLPLVADRIVFLPEVILLERGRGREVVVRARKLGSEALSRMSLQLLLSGLLVLGLWWGASKFAEMMVGTLTIDWPEGPVARLALHVGAWTAVAFFGVGRFLGYIDRRIRQEGWEVDLRLRAAGATLEAGPSW
jgi:hypothetical protein